MYFKKSLILLIFSVLSSFSFAQYGNEWIDYNQTYYKFKIGEEGIYKVTYETLDSLGLPVTTLNPKNIQLYAKGAEVAIYVSGELDNSFDPGDFIEFYATRNDGWLDKDLYRRPEEHTNPYRSLFSDSSVYFLTISKTLAQKRVVDYYNGNYSNKKADNYFNHEIVYTHGKDFYSGIPVNNDAAQAFSEYTEGEGFHTWIWSSQKRIDISTPSIYQNGPAANIDIVAFSSTNNKDVIVNNYNHEFGVSIGKKSNSIAKVKTLGHSKIRINQSFNNSNILSVIEFSMERH